MNEKEKYSYLKEFVKNESAIDELLTYAENKFIPQKNNALPLENSYIDAWEEYYQESKEIGAFETLKKYIPRLQFPIQEGISKTEAYKDVTLRGKPHMNKAGLVLNEPALIQVTIYQNNMIGKVPVIIVPNDDDFNTIITAISNKNEPQQLPKSMGASFINGIINWDRIHRLKRNWLAQNPMGHWNVYFKEQILPKPYLFKDKLMVLSTKAYSGIKSEIIGVSENNWKSSSLIIRRAHECAHLFTLQYYGCMAINMHDEIIADYAGITEVLGKFNKEWFLQFVGLENYPAYRNGGRLQNYQGATKLSQEAFDGLKTIVKKVTDTIFSFDTILGEIKTPDDQLNRIKSICETDLITMASSEGVEKLIEKYNCIKISPYHDYKKQENIRRS